MLMFKRNEVEIVLKQDCDIPASALNLHRLARELGVKVSQLRVSKLAEEPEAEYLAQGVFPGGRIASQSAKSTLGFFAYTPGEQHTYHRQFSTC